MKAIILSAGQGSRLLPLTSDRPKCLLPVGARTVLEWQIHALAQNGIRDIAVVTGFKAELVDAALSAYAHAEQSVETIFNPFYKVADNLASCWLARAHMHGDFVVINGDTLFEPQILARLLKQSTDGAALPICVTIDRKSAYDTDDMKVCIANGSVREIGKTLPPERTQAESIGMIAFRGTGPRQFIAELDRTMRAGEGLNAWYLQAISRLAGQGHVGAVSIEGMEWAEIDVATDLERAAGLAHGWARSVVRAVRSG